MKEKSQPTRKKKSQARRAPVAVGETVDVVCTALPFGTDAETHLARDADAAAPYRLFVPGLLPGERARARVTLARKTYGRGELVERLTDSADRVDPFCPHYANCGGCQRQHAQPAMRRQAKLDRLREMLVDAFGADRAAALDVAPIRGDADPRHYRLKAAMAIGGTPGWGLRVGFYRPHDQSLVSIDDDCPVQNHGATQLILHVTDAARRAGVAPYVPRENLGDLKHLVVRTGIPPGGRVSDPPSVVAGVDSTSPEGGSETRPPGVDRALIIVSRTEDFPGRAALVESACNHTDAPATSVWQSVSPREGSAVLGSRTFPLWPTDPGTFAGYHATVAGVTFRVSPASFFQTSATLARELADVVPTLLMRGLETDSLDGVRVVEAYAGVGLIGLVLARLGADVLAVEASPQPVADAKHTAREEQLDGRFSIVEAAVEDFLPGLLRDPQEHAAGTLREIDAVVLDPPRSGCQRPVIDAVRALSPRVVVLVSCDPGSLIRDLAAFADPTGPGCPLAPRTLVPIDGFPHAYGLETVTLLAPS